MERGEHKISYVRKPFAKRSFMAAILTGAASFLGILGVYLAVAGNGSLSGNILITALERGGVFSQLFPEQGKQAR